MDPAIKEYFERLNAALDDFRVDLRTNTDAVKSYTTKLDALVIGQPDPEKRVSETSVAVAALQQGHASPSATLGEEGLNAPIYVLLPVTDAVSSPMPMGVTLSACNDKSVDTHIDPAPPAVVKEVRDTAAVENQGMATEAQAANIALDVELALTTPSSHEQYGPDISGHDACVSDESLSSPVTRPAELVPLIALSSFLLESAVVHQSDALALIRCSTEYLIQGDDRVQPKYATLLCNNINDSLAYVSNGEELQLEELHWQPWPPPLRVWIKHRGCMLSPSLWPTFQYHSDASSSDNPCSAIHSQPHEVSRSSVGLVLFLFRDEDPLQVWRRLHWRKSWRTVSMNFIVAGSVPVVSFVQSLYEFHPHVPQTSCTRMFSVSTELQSYDGPKLRPRPWPLFEFNQETVQRKLQWTSVSGNGLAMHVLFEQHLCSQLNLWVMNMPMYEQFKKILERCATTRGAKGLSEIEFRNVDAWSDLRGPFAVAIHVSCTVFSGHELVGIHRKQLSSQEMTQLKPLWPSLSCNYRAIQVLSMSARYLSRVQLKLCPSERASYAFRAQDVQPRVGFSQKNIQLKLPGPSLSCDMCVLTSASSSTSYNLCVCSSDNKCVLVIQCLTNSIQEPIDSVHKSRVHTNAVCAFVVCMFQQRSSLNWVLRLNLNQRPPLADLGTVDSNTTNLCTSTVHLHDLVPHRILGMSGSVRSGGNQYRCELRAEGLNGTNLVETESGQYIKMEDIIKDCSIRLLFQLYKIQQILRIHIPIHLLARFFSLDIKNWLLWAPATLSKNVNFLSQKSSNGGLLLMARSTQSHHLTDFATRRKCCLELLPALDVCIAMHSELLSSMGKLGLSELLPDDYNCFFYWL